MPESLTSTNGIIYPLIDYRPMFGKVDKNTVLNNVHKALRASDLQFEVKEVGWSYSAPWETTFRSV